MFFKETRIELEKRMVGVMIEMYCRKCHDGGDNLCPECTSLYSYAQRRLDKCVFQNEKPTCGNCPIHCYKPDMRQKVKLVMRYSGPRMFYKHPMLAILHAVDGMWKKKPRPALNKIPDKNNGKSSDEEAGENNDKGAP
jgi:hypothetical protein